MGKKRTLPDIEEINFKSTVAVEENDLESPDAAHSNVAFDLSLGIVAAGYAFEAYAKPVRH